MLYLKFSLQHSLILSFLNKTPIYNTAMLYYKPYINLFKLLWNYILLQLNIISHKNKMNIYKFIKHIYVHLFTKIKQNPFGHNISNYNLCSINIYFIIFDFYFCFITINHLYFFSIQFYYICCSKFSWCNMIS